MRSSSATRSMLSAGYRKSGPKLVKTSDNTEQMLRFELENGNETIRNYRERVGQCEALGEHAMAAQICEILAYEQQHHIELATAWGNRVPDITLL